MSRRRAKLVRWTRRAALCLALGLGTAVAVAWGLAVWLPHEKMWVKQTETWLGPEVEPTEVVRLRAAPGFPETDAVIALAPNRPKLITTEVGRAGMLRRRWIVDRFGLYLDLLEPELRILNRPVSCEGPRWRRSVSPDDEPQSGYQDARGWPSLCLWSEFKYDGSGGIRVEGGHLLVDSGYSFDIGSFDNRALPLRPIWGGLVANTVVYAGAWAVLLMIHGSVRRAHRCRKGRCVGCGYDLRGLAAGAVCPECGEGQQGARAP